MLKPPTRWLFAIFVVAVSFFIYFRYVLAFGVNVPYWDDFQLLDQARLVHAGRMEWWKLAANKHNEHLMGVPFTLEALEFLWTGFDYKLQLVTGVLIQGLTFLLLAWAVWKSIPQGRRSYWLAFSSLILFSLAQYKNLLWAFQTAWFLVSLLLVINLICLQRASEIDAARGDGASAWFTGAVFAALLASFTSFQGSIVWVAGGVFLFARCSFKLKESLRNILFRRWAISAVLSVIVITYIFEKLGGFGPETGVFHLRTFLDIFIGVHGDLWGNWGVHRLLRFGFLMLALLLVALAQVCLSKEKAEYAFSVSLMAFGVLFVFLISLGRARFGSDMAGDSHYTAYPILTYFGVLSILYRKDDSLPKFYPSRLGQFCVGAILSLAWFSSAYYATVSGISWRSDHGLSAAQLINHREESDLVLVRNLFGDAAMVRRNADFLEANKFSAFGDSAAVPESVKSYVNMPKSMEAAMARHPGQEKAIRMAWEVYQVGGDLRSAFNPLSPQFPHDLLQWCFVSAQPGAAHYVSPYLAPYAADFSAIDKAGY
jgi:hypothetical protein